MREQGRSEFESEPTDNFGLTRERRMQTAHTNVDLILRRCMRQDVQPRDMMLRAMSNQEEMRERLGDLADQLIQKVESLPDYDLSNPDEREAAAAALAEVYSEVINPQFADPDSESAQDQQRDRRSREQWQEAGMFSYELGEDHELILHVPPMSEGVKPQQLKNSLHTLAHVVEGDPDIQKVRGSSLLLEHPVARRLGFTIDMAHQTEDLTQIFV